MRDQYQKFCQKIQDLRQHENILDRLVEELNKHKDALKRDPIYGKHAYITYEDLEMAQMQNMFKDSSDSEEEQSQDSSHEATQKFSFQQTANLHMDFTNEPEKPKKT
mmetsp:Transcript_3452/g.3409  ORF Transcript_3452/g.3409 Transcript_3452/m.3409 type:complete len:107 (+) Transcript_3452:530-850(+)|eukprot:CAMPEP_0170565346 /NCGR_PEP_ID=MMETSP0211-20121228/78280_1 /TAXON_ID=311385 /ORGANISM="Pseudokeronopsis sp., Strain OXSARD2" /LENGTH=106 /DNA_ID=CAMNT_0010886033 /DNA_START=453 /DNA_END=773 /DNA_ORIENTATION=-